eukprot:s2132_g13.t1
MPPARKQTTQARQAAMRQYDMALCRAATEHKSRDALKEKAMRRIRTRYRCTPLQSHGCGSRIRPCQTPRSVTCEVVACT